MTDIELLEKVKAGLSADDSIDDDNSLLIKTIGVKQYMINSGISEEQIATELGVATLTIGVNDIWDLTSGALKFSMLFHNFVSQLAIKSLPAD